jgi:hypothetical protein
MTDPIDDHHRGPPMDDHDVAVQVRIAHDIVIKYHEADRARENRRD